MIRKIVVHIFIAPKKVLGDGKKEVGSGTKLKARNLSTYANTFNYHHMNGGKKYE